MNIFLRFILSLVASISFGIANASIVVKEQSINSVEKAAEGVLTRMELFNFQMLEFNLLDLDNNGLITKEELNKIGFPKDSIESLFLMLDEDKNSSIKKSEVLYRVSRDFDIMDENKDGNLSVEELQKYLISVVPIVYEEIRVRQFDEPIIDQQYIKENCHEHNKKHCGSFHHKGKNCEMMK